MYNVLHSPGTRYVHVLEVYAYMLKYIITNVGVHVQIHKQ